MTLMADCFDANLRVLDSRSESEICQTLRETCRGCVHHSATGACWIIVAVVGLWGHGNLNSGAVPTLEVSGMGVSCIGSSQLKRILHHGYLWGSGLQMDCAIGLQRKNTKRSRRPRTGHCA